MGKRRKRRSWFDDEKREICQQTTVPIEIEADVAVEPTPIYVQTLSPSGSLCASRVDITLSDDRRILVEGPTALTAVISLVQGLAV